MCADRAPTIVGLGGSLARVSRSLTALGTAAVAAEDAGAHVRVFDVKTLELPFYRPGIDAPKAALTFADAVYAADGLLLSSPMYHGSISGSFKNALDWLDLLARRDPPYLTDKLVGFISTAGGLQGLKAVNTLEFVVRSLRAWAVPLVIPISLRQAFDADARIVDDRIAGQLRALGREVAEVCLQRRGFQLPHAQLENSKRHSRQRRSRDPTNRHGEEVKLNVGSSNGRHRRTLRRSDRLHRVGASTSLARDGRS